MKSSKKLVEDFKSLRRSINLTQICLIITIAVLALTVLILVSVLNRF